jgi:hypothetical protein
MLQIHTHTHTRTNKTLTHSQCFLCSGLHISSRFAGTRAARLYQSHRLMRGTNHRTRHQPAAAGSFPVPKDYAFAAANRLQSAVSQRGVPLRHRHTRRPLIHLLGNNCSSEKHVQIAFDALVAFRRARATVSAGAPRVLLARTAPVTLHLLRLPPLHASARSWRLL